MPSGLSLLPTIAIAAVTTSVSLAAAMGGVQTLIPAAAHTNLPAQVATVAPSTHGRAPAAAAAATLAAHHAGAVAAARTTPATPATTTHTPPAQASATCTPSDLPAQANGVGNRCQPGPPAAVPGKGDPAAGKGHATPAPTPSNHGKPPAPPSHPTPTAHLPAHAPT